MRTLSPHIQTLLLLHIVTIASMALNIPIVRQFSVFVYFTFVPGFAILRILKLEERDATFRVLFSAGLSIVFLMSAGLLINELYPLLGISEPLSVLPLTMTLMGLTVILLFMGYKRVQRDSAKTMKVDFLAHITKKTLFKAFVLILPPVLGIIGALYAYTPTLIIMIMLVAVLIALAAFSQKFLPSELYPLAILAIGLGLIFHMTFISKYNFGYDINTEYYVFKITQIQAHWIKPGAVLTETQIANFQSDLSVTILPTVYADLVNISGELTFKLVFGFIFSLVPLVLYRMFEAQTGKTFAFLSAFVFMSTPYSFYGTEILGLNRQMLAELFFVLSVFLIIDKSIGIQKRTILFLIFSFGVVASHYSTSYIYLLFIAFTFILSYKYGNGGVLTKEVVLFVCAITFSWYIYVSNSAYLNLISNIENILRSFSSDLFSSSARSTYAFTMLNPSTSSSIVGLIHRLIVYCQNGLIVIGVLLLFIRRKETRFSREYKYISVFSMVLLVLAVAVPNLAPTLEFQRFYQITLLFVGPFFFFGGLAIIEFIRILGSHLSILRMPILGKLQPAIPRNLGLQLLTLLLVTSFLFQVGLVSHVTETAPISYSLDLNREKTSSSLYVLESLYEVYIPEQDVFSAKWYLRNIGQEPEVYVDRQSQANVLTAYGLVNRTKTHAIYNTTVFQRSAYVYLRYFNIRHNTMVSFKGLFNTSSFDALNQIDTIYSNGASEIRWAP
jgi:uncharacterized membrane protein